MEAHRALETDCLACHSPFRGSRPERCVQCHSPPRSDSVTTQGVAIGEEQNSSLSTRIWWRRTVVACRGATRRRRPFTPSAASPTRCCSLWIGERCDGCHRGPQDALHRQISGGCGEFHTQEAWTPATFDHDRYFILDGTTRRPATPVTSTTTAAAALATAATSTHASGIREKHLEESVTQYEDCLECHRSGEAEGDEHEGRGSNSQRRLRSRV